MPMKDRFRRGEFNIYSCQVDQVTLEETVTLVHGDKVVARVKRRPDGSEEELAVD